MSLISINALQRLWRRAVRAEYEALDSLAVREPEYKTIMHTPTMVIDR